MESVWVFLIGMGVGGSLGMILMALLAVGAKADEDQAIYYQGHKVGYEEGVKNSPRP